jgi:phosphate-selective porin OprO/OprP
MSIRSTWRLLFMLLFATPSVALAQGAVTAGWQDGFFIQSADGDFRVNLGTTFQTDGRIISGDQPPVTDTFAIRKARINVGGRVAKYFEFRIVPDFGSGTTTVPDAYVDMRLSHTFAIRTGKDKTPIGYELLIGDPWVLMTERSLASSLVPNRDVGVQALGDLAGNRLTFAIGAFNGVPDGTSSSADLDTNNGKDLAGRIAIQPFRKANGGGGALSGLGFHLGASRGDEGGALPTFRTSVGQAWFSYDRAAVAAGEHDRVTPAVFYYHARLGAFAEFVRSSQAVARATTTSRIANSGWGVTSSYVLTGDATTDRGVRPSNPFDPQTGKWGAMQLVARFSQLAVDRRAFDAGLAAADAQRRADQFTVGVNWYPARPVKYYVDFERTTYEARDAVSPVRRPENALMVRAQVAF